MHVVQSKTDIIFEILFLQLRASQNMLLWALLFLSGAKLIILDNPDISPDNNEVLANSSLELVCNTHENVTGTVWGTINHLDTFAHLYYSHEGACSADGFLADSRYFETSCFSNGTYKVNIKRINISNHGERWYCSHGFRDSNIAYITVRAPAKIVNITFHSNKNVYIQEDEMQTFSCNSSACFPKPTVKWYLRNSTFTEDITDLSTTSTISQKDGLISAEGILHVLLNRTHDSWYLHCEVWTGSTYSDISSKEILLNVAYPPDGPPIIIGYEQDKIFQIVESESVKLNCTVTGGKPLATLKMACFNTNTTQNASITETTVTTQIASIANRNYSKCTCESDHLVGGTQKTYVRFDVLFPPSDVHFTILVRQSESGKFVVNKNEELTLKCIAESNPHPEIMIINPSNEKITWKINNISVQHTIHNVSCTDAGEYSCSARNLLTFGEGVISRLILIVKCPPKPFTGNLKEMKLTAVLHSDVTLQFLAQEYFDEENNTIFTWYNQNSSLHNGGRKYILSSFGLQSTLIIRNMTQSDYGQYRVEVKNSIGHYIHYYKLQEKEATQPKKDSTLIWTLIGVSAGVSAVFTIVAGVVAFLCCKFIRKKQSQKQSPKQKAEDIHENQSTFNSNEIEAMHEYEDLDDDYRIDDRPYVEMQTMTEGDNTHRDYITPTL